MFQPMFQWWPKLPPHFKCLSRDMERRLANQRDWFETWSALRAEERIFSGSGRDWRIGGSPGEVSQGFLIEVFKYFTAGGQKRIQSLLYNQNRSTLSSIASFPNHLYYYYSILLWQSGHLEQSMVKPSRKEESWVENRLCSLHLSLSFLFLLFLLLSLCTICIKYSIPTNPFWRLDETFDFPSNPLSTS